MTRWLAAALALLALAAASCGRYGPPRRTPAAAPAASTAAEPAAAEPDERAEPSP
jgi:predicted small lipoprotein YifL